MLVGTDSVLGMQVRAADGPCGRLEDLYFDDERWAVRFLEVPDEDRLPGRVVVLTPGDVSWPDPPAGALTTALTRRQLAQTRSVDAGPAGPTRSAGAGPEATWPEAAALDNASPRADAELPFEADALPEPPPPCPTRRLPRLRSACDLLGCAVHARGRRVGRLAGFLLDADTLAIRYLVVEAAGRHGKSVLLSTVWVTDVSGDGRDLTFDLPRKQVLSSPAYLPGQEVGPEYEADLFEHYRNEG